jgi:uncharacterized protein (DUF2267 family)
LGERDYAWETPTEKLINIVLASLRKYVSDGEISDMLATLPSEIQSLFA